MSQVTSRFPRGGNRLRSKLRWRDDHLLREQLTFASSTPSSTATFKRVVNLDRVIGDETVGPTFDALGFAKKCFRVLQPALPANKRTEAPRCKIRSVSLERCKLAARIRHRCGRSGRQARRLRILDGRGRRYQPWERRQSRVDGSTLSQGEQCSIQCAAQAGHNVNRRARKPPKLRASLSGKRQQRMTELL